MDKRTDHVSSNPIPSNQNKAAPLEDARTRPEQVTTPKEPIMPLDDGNRAQHHKGEGDHLAGRRYQEAAKQFAHSGQLDKKAQEARKAIDDPQEAAEMKEAERIGRSKAKEEDPELKKQGTTSGGRKM